MPIFFFLKGALIIFNVLCQRNTFELGGTPPQFKKVLIFSDKFCCIRRDFTTPSKKSLWPSDKDTFIRRDFPPPIFLQKKQKNLFFSPPLHLTLGGLQWCLTIVEVKNGKAIRVDIRFMPYNR